MHADKRGLEGYAKAPYPEAAFAKLATWMNDASDWPQLRELVAMHLKQRPTDSLAWLWQGDLLRKDKKYDQADAAYATGLANDPPAERAERLLERRVYTRFLAGKGLEAYTELGEGEAIFDQLAGLFASDNEPSNLQALIDLHRKHFTNDPLLAARQGQVYFQLKAYKQAVDELKEFRKHEAPEGRPAPAVNSMIVRSLLKLDRALDALSDARAHEYVYGIAMSSAALGDVKGTIAALKKWQEDENDVSTIYEDAAFEPYLTDPRFQPLRDAFPPPAKRADAK
jgi:tetratricopeptide (TPR) repeat protein